MATQKHEVSEKNEKGQVATVVWWTLSCDVSGCDFTAQGEKFHTEGQASAALEYHIGMKH